MSVTPRVCFYGADFRGDLVVSCGNLLDNALLDLLSHGATQTDAFLRSMGVVLEAVCQTGGHGGRCRRAALACVLVGAVLI